MTSETAPFPDDDLAADRRRDRVCDAFEDEWAAGRRPRIEDFLSRVEPPEQVALFRELLRLELALRRTGGENPAPADYAARFPTRERVVREQFAGTPGGGPSKSRPLGPAARFKAGDTVAGRYRIVAAIGAGGMGEVYRAYDEELEVQVALKFLPAARAADTNWRKRLKEEVTNARSVTHENVCRVHDLGDPDGVPFLIMEYVDGKSLEAVLRMVRRVNQEQVIAYARQLCDGLAAIHDKNVIHRDLKPANVLLDADGKVLLADFGLAASADDVGADESGVGTVLYMAPEQLAAAKVEEPHRIDLFALGLILYELTTGERPFPGRTRDELTRQHADGPPRAPAALVPGIDPALDQVILRCLEPKPQNRPASARAVKDALPPLSPAKTADQGGSGKLRPRAAVALLAAALVGLLANAALAPRTMAFHRVGPSKSPEILRDKAAELARLFGYTDRVEMEVGSIEWDAALVRFDKNKPPYSWPAVPPPGTPAMYFSYRSSPFPLIPDYRVSPADPPMTVPGMVCVLFDLSGNLLEFHAVPKRERDADAGKAAPDPTEELFRRAALKREEFRPAASVRLPPVFADAVAAYEKIDGSGLRVDLATCAGRPVYFRVCHPRDADETLDRTQYRTQQSPVAAQKQLGLYGLVALILLLVLAVPVTLRNIQLGRCDTRSAVRLGGVYFVTVLLGWLLSVHHGSSLGAERELFVRYLGEVTFWGGMMLVLYLALEPSMRSRWPERLSSWNRLLGGRLGDPMVGRDILIGVAIGTVMGVVPKVIALSSGTFVLFSTANEAIATSIPVGNLLILAAAALTRTIAGFAYLVLLGLALRREGLALAILVVHVAVNYQTSLITFDPNHWGTWVGCGLLGGLVVLTIARFGLTTTLASHFTAYVLAIMSVTVTPERWYADVTMISAGVLVVLAVYGFFVSLGGQRLFPDHS